MLLLLIVTAYLVTVASSVWATVISFRSPRSFFGRHRLRVWLVMVAEVAYMLQAPACVYLPRAPGKPAVRKVILGTDAQGTLYWMEGRSPVAFAWGPRWWLATGALTVRYGLEVLPPVRYALNAETRGRDQHATRWELLDSLGGRSLLRETWQAEGLTAERTYRPVVAEDGTVVVPWDRGLHRVLRDSGTIRPFLSSPDDEKGLVQGAATLGNGHVLEVVEEFWREGRCSRWEKGVGPWHLVLREMDLSGREVRRLPLAVPEPTECTSGPGPMLLAVTEIGPMLFQTWEFPVNLADGPGGRAYRLSPEFGDPVPICSFEFDRLKPLSLAVSRDGTLFTTGQAILRMDGEKVQDLIPALAYCAWSGHTLYGVRRYPFFAETGLQRYNQFNVLSMAATGNLEIRHRDTALATIAEGQSASAWAMGGIDESGHEDEIVKVVLP